MALVPGVPCRDDGRVSADDSFIIPISAHSRPAVIPAWMLGTSHKDVVVQTFRKRLILEMPSMALVPGVPCRDDGRVSADGIFIIPSVHTLAQPSSQHGLLGTSHKDVVLQTFRKRLIQEMPSMALVPGVPCRDDGRGSADDSFIIPISAHSRTAVIPAWMLGTSHKDVVLQTFRKRLIQEMPSMALVPRIPCRDDAGKSCHQLSRDST